MRRSTSILVLALAAGACSESSTDHDHDGRYAASTHGHDAADVVSGTIADTRIPGTIARASDVFATVLASDGPGSGLDADTLDGRDGADFVSTTRIVVVGPRPTPVESGSALAAAVDAITDASGARPYLVWLEPGLYDMGSGSLTMKEWVSVTGSGRRVTRVTSTAGTGGTVRVAANSTLSRLTVENASTANEGFAITTGGAGPRTLADLAVEVIGSPNNATGISQGGGVLHVERVSVEVDGNFSSGIASQNGVAVIRDSQVTVVGGASISWALWTNGGLTAADVLVVNSVLRGPQGIRLGSTVEPAVVRVHHSLVDAAGDAADLTAGATELAVANSMFQGTVDNAAGGTFRCFGSYGATFAPVCP